MNNKNHAKDYLLEYATGKPDWLKSLIQEAIDTNGAITEERLEAIFENLKNNSPIPLQTNQSVAQTTTDKILFKTLKHVSGVNALCENQIIKFSPDVTVLYGLNGSGKSGYFRILNEICGGNQKKEILPNIYADDANKKDISVQLEYSKGTNTNTLNWDNTTRAISDFQGVKVFDSSYLNGLLISRTPDEAVVYPLGLHLFSYIAQIMDSFSVKLTQLATTEREKLPAIITDNLRDDLKNAFNQKQDFNNAKRTEIKEKYSFSEAENTLLSEKQATLTKLQQTNYEDRIKLLTQNNKTYSEFIEKIGNIVKNLKEYSQNLKSAFDTYKSAKEKNDKALLQSQVLKSLPQSNTEEWKKFIKAGKEYSSKLGDEEKKKCPYCHQDIVSEDAVKIIQAYTAFLNDTSAGELDTAAENLGKIQNTINGYDVSVSLTEIVKSIISDSETLERKLTSLIDYKQSLLSAKNVDDIQTLNTDFSIEIKDIQDAIGKNDKELESLNASKTEKEKTIATLQTEIVVLKEKKSISEQKDAIDAYFTIQDKVKDIENKRSSLNTKGLTGKSNQAQDELLTPALESRLKQELEKLGRKDLKVQLKVSNGSKGKCSTELLLIGDNSIKSVLSEGEQKAVGLAVFFAEIQNETYPIILDDPTTSLDHRIAAKLANRLLSFNNQIVVFTHYQLFMNSLSSTDKGHFCDKYGESTCGKHNKHIYTYEIDENLSEKGIVNQYLQRDSKCVIAKIENEISTINSGDLKDVPKNMRKCVEYLIDEVILNGQLLRKYCGGEPIKWGELKKINSASSNIVDKLHEIHGRVSGGEIHVDMESEENSPTVQELQEFLQDLKAIQAGTYNQQSGVIQ